MGIQSVPVLSAHERAHTGHTAKQPGKLTDTLNEAVVIIFFSLGPAVGATIFLMWIGGLAWGLLSSFH